MSDLSKTASDDATLLLPILSESISQFQDSNDKNVPIDFRPMALMGVAE
jgi:hypothetical protein